MALASEIAKKNILIVEDAISMRHTVKAALRNQGFENLFESADGEKALKIIKRKKIDCIISDWVMPNMSGLELFSASKEGSQYKHIPFILLTGNDQKESVTEAIKAGIKHYVVKPFNPFKLFEKAVELLQQQKIEQAVVGVSK